MEKTKNDYKTLLLATQGSHPRRVRQDIDAYLAGFFDGEGHISVRCDPRRPWSYYVEVGATQICREPLDLLVRAYGGKVHPKKPSRKGLRGCWGWKCGSKDAFWALWRMLPWLLVKREKARAAVIVLQHRPLQINGGQISQYQKTAIAKAVKQLGHVIEVQEKRWGSGRSQKAASGVPATATERISLRLPGQAR